MDKQTFERLRNEWREDTWHMASPKEKAMHPAYQRIIDHGQEAVPLIIEEMKENGTDHWFWALQAVTGENPIPESHRGRMEKMKDDWIEWYEEN